MRCKAFLAAVALVTAPAGFIAVGTPAFAQEGAGDEATLNSHRLDLEKKLSAAERSGTISRSEAARHRRALDSMVRSAKSDLRRPPHLISAAENATYQRTIRNVEAALAKPRR